MLVRFDSSETGEVLMYADVAKVLLQAMGKETTARGAFLPEQMLPAVGQGALGLELRRADENLLEQLRFLHHDPTAVAVAAE